MMDFSREQLEAFIQACISEEDVPEEDLKTLESLMRTESRKAREVALQLLDESMIRSWFRSQADNSFINEVQRRLDIRFQDEEFISAVMHRVRENVDACEGTPGATLHKDPVRPVSMLRYILVPLCAALIYVALVHGETLKDIFTDSGSTLMTVENFQGRPDVISAGKSRAAILKQIIRPGDTLNSEDNDTLQLRYPDDSTVEVPANSSLIIVDSDSRKVLKILRGSLKINISAQPQTSPFTIKTLHGDLLVRQGRLTLEIRDSQIYLKTAAGSADFLHFQSDSITVLNAGSSATVNEKHVQLNK